MKSSKRNQHCLATCKSYLDLTLLHILLGLDFSCNSDKKDSKITYTSFTLIMDEINFQCAQIIKDSLDKNYGGAGYWNVVVGESFDVIYY